MDESAPNSYRAAQCGVEQLLAAVPALVNFPLPILSEQVVQLDSKDMDVSVWQRLLRRCVFWLAQDDVQGLVITHGTDTLEETAFLLQAVLPATKPVVLTCAMRPATALSADGPQNLWDAIQVAAHPAARGVVVVCAGVLHDAREVQKVRSWQLDAFSSGDAGALGHIVQGALHMTRAWPSPDPVFNLATREKIMDAPQWPRVEIVMSYAQAQAATVDALVDAETARRHDAAPVQGLVVAGTGAATVHQQLEQALLRAQASGVQVVRASRCVWAQAQPQADTPFEALARLSPVKARIGLMLTLLA